MSSGSPRRLSGIRAANLSFAARIGVSIAPGLTALTRMPRGRSSADSVRAKERTAALEAERSDSSAMPTRLSHDVLRMTTEPGPIDLAASADGAFLYGETGVTGTVDEYAIDGDGTLTKLGTIGDLPPGLEGIAAT